MSQKNKASLLSMWFKVLDWGRLTERLDGMAAGFDRDGGVTMVMDSSLKIEHARYVGRMHRLGFTTRRITSVRTGLQ